MKTKLLIATTERKELVFANIETNRKYFSICFDEVYAIEVSSEYLKERLENNLECYDKESLFELCETYDCSPSELADKMYINLTVEEIIDISLFPDEFRVNGVDDSIYFESNGCGQHDTRGFSTPINEHIYNMIHDAWDAWHLKSLEEINPEKLNSFIEQIEEYEQTFDETDTIQNFLNKWFK